MTIEKIRSTILMLVSEYNLKRVILFGSRASMTNAPDSDVDLIVEFFGEVSLMKLASLRCRLEDLLEIDVDIIHGPIRPDDMIEIGKEIELYAA